MKYIPLTKGLAAIVDDEDWPAVERYSWHAKPGANGLPYALTKVNGRRTLMHRLILGLAEPRPIVDHRNGDTLDNRRENLRLATHAENGRNRRRRVDSSVPFKGVGRLSRRTGRKQWYARIYKDGARRNLGCFETPRSAALGYDAAARELYGEFACLNFPRPGERSALTGLIAPPLVVSNNNTFTGTLF